jgi:hypothetical protein
VGLDLCSFEVAQQLLLAQLPGLQARSTGALDRMQDRTESGVAAKDSANAKASDRTILLSTTIIL